MIVRDAKMRLGCADFGPDFTLHETRDQLANSDVHTVRNVDDWPPDCAQAFKEAAARARPQVRHRVAGVARLARQGAQPAANRATKEVRLSHCRIARGR